MNLYGDRAWRRENSFFRRYNREGGYPSGNSRANTLAVHTILSYGGKFFSVSPPPLKGVD